MKKFCKDLREHATKIINYEKKDMIPLTKKEEKNHNNQKVCYICKKEFDTSDKKHHKVEIIVIIQVNIEEQLIIFVT